MSRSCGGCTLCCKHLEITELSKPQDEWCPNCKIGVGCQIWNQEGYPPSCHVYQCIWLMHPQVPEEFRPDKVKAVLGSTTDGENLVVYSRTKDLSHTPVLFRDWIIEHMLKFMNVIIVCGKTRVVFAKRYGNTPPPDLSKGLTTTKEVTPVSTPPKDE